MAEWTSSWPPMRRRERQKRRPTNTRLEQRARSGVRSETDSVARLMVHTRQAPHAHAQRCVLMRMHVRRRLLQHAGAEAAAASVMIFARR